MGDAAARRATPDDVAVLGALGTTARAEVGGQRGGALWSIREDRGPLTAERVTTLLADPRALVLIGTFDDVPLGYAIAHLDDLADGTRLLALDELYVEPEARGVGIGEALMDEVLARAAADGCRGVDAFVLPGNRDAKNFFERFGLTARAILVHRGLSA